MSKKPAISVRKPPTDADKVAAFIGGNAETSKRPDVQTSKRPDRRQTTIYFDQDIAKRLKVHCAVEGAEMSATVTEAVRRYLDALDAGDL